MEFDLAVPQWFAKQDPALVFKRTCADDLIQWATGRIQQGCWSITRYEDALVVYREARSVIPWGCPPIRRWC